MTLTALNAEQASARYEGTYLPGEPPEHLTELLQTVSRNRFTRLLAIQAEVQALCPEDGEESGFFSAVFDLICMVHTARQALIDHPVFQAWADLALRALNVRVVDPERDPGKLRAWLDEFPVMLSRVRAEAKTDRPSFFGRNMDPLIASVLPPSYEPALEQDGNAAANTGHPLSFFKDVVQVARERIHVTWPEALQQFDRVVHTIGYLPDAQFRSCSASRFTGIILLSSRDRSLLDLEESLVHEAGHQLLYNIVDADPISDDDRSEQYALPWSGQVRDLYGYFHAFFIYVLLAYYHERAIARPGKDGQLAGDRLRHILRGLVKAVPDLQSSVHLTHRGRTLLGALSHDIDGLTARHRAVLAT